MAFKCLYTSSTIFLLIFRSISWYVFFLQWYNNIYSLRINTSWTIFNLLGIFWTYIVPEILRTTHHLVLHYFPPQNTSSIVVTANVCVVYNESILHVWPSVFFLTLTIASSNSIASLLFYAVCFRFQRISCELFSNSFERLLDFTLVAVINFDIVTDLHLNMSVHHMFVVWLMHGTLFWFINP